MWCLMLFGELITHCFKKKIKQNIGTFFKINFIGISTLPKISGCSQICGEITLSNNKYSVNQDLNFHAALLPVFHTALFVLHPVGLFTYMHSEISMF